MNTLSSKDIMEKYLPQNATIVEAGAHIGRDTRKMALRWPTATIHAFEPIPELFAQLTANTQDLPNVKRYNIGLGETNGTAQLHVSSGRSNAASSVLAPELYLTQRPDIIYEKVIEIQTVTLDSWAQQNNIQKIDAAWLDLQGYEYFILKASPKTLSQLKVFVTEVNCTQRFAQHPLYPEFRAWLEEQGFEVVHEDLSKGTWGNIVCVKK